MPRRRRSLSKNPGVDKGPQPLMFNPALTTCASERMKTQRFSYFADFAARRPAAAGQFRPVSRGGTSCFLREAKPVKLKKWHSATFLTLCAAQAAIFCFDYISRPRSLYTATAMLSRM